MGSEYVYVFDYKNSYDKLRIPDIPRPTVRYRLDGHITEENNTEPRYDQIDLIIIAARTRPNPESYREIALRTNRGKSSIGQRAQKLKNCNPYLMENMA